MASIQLNMKLLSTKVLPYISSASSVLDDAITSAATLKSNLPSDFTKFSTVNSIITDIGTLKNSVNGISLRILQKVMFVQGMESKNAKDISVIGDQMSFLPDNYGPVFPTLNNFNDSNNVYNFGFDLPVMTNNDYMGVYGTDLPLTDGYYIVNGDGYNSIIMEGSYSQRASLNTNFIKYIPDNNYDNSGEYMPTFAKVYTSFSNLIIKAGKGLVNFVEEIGDTALLFLSAYANGQQANARYYAPSKINQVSPKVDFIEESKPVTAYNWSDEIYEKGPMREFLNLNDKYAYKPFKSDGFVCQFAEEATYTTSIVVVSSLAGPYAGAARVLLGGAAGAGRQLEEGYNKNTLTISDGVKDSNLTVNYNDYQKIKNLSNGQKYTVKSIVVNEEGIPVEVTYQVIKRKGNTYDIYDQNGKKMEFKNLKESDTEKSIAIAMAKGLWDGAQWYIGDKISSSQFSSVVKYINDPKYKSLFTHSARMGLDTITAASEAPFQSFITMVSDDISYEEAWEKSGGNKTLLLYTLLGLVGSGLGEGVDVFQEKKMNKLLNKYDDLITTKTSDEYIKYMENKKIGKKQDVNHKFENLDDEIKEVETKLIKKLEPKAKSNNGDEKRNTKQINDGKTDANVSKAKQINDGKTDANIKNTKEINDGKTDANVKNTKEINDGKTDANVKNTKEINKDFGKAKQCYDKLDVAITFNDSKQLLFYKLEELKNEEIAKNIYDGPYLKKYQEVCFDKNMKDPDFNGKRATVNISEIDLYNFLDSHGQLSSFEKNLIEKLRSNSVVFTEKEKDILYLYTAFYGPVHGAYSRKALTRFGENFYYDGNDINEVQDLLNMMIDRCNQYHKPMPYYTVEEVDSVLEQIVNKSPLKEDLILYRGVNNLFFEGSVIDANKLKNGTIINDESYLSTSVVPTKIAKDSDYILEIYAPAGTKGCYIENVTSVKSYDQQEFLLNKNTYMEIVGMPEEIIIDGKKKIKIKAKIISTDDVNLMKKNIEYNSYNKMYEVSDGVTLKQFKDKMDEYGVSDRYIEEVRDMKIKGLYNEVELFEHDYKHVENVLLYSMYMGKELGLSDDEMEILIDCAKYHDTGLNNMGNNHKGHSDISSDIALNDLAIKYNYDERKLNIITSIIQYHEYEDKLLKQICNRNGIYHQDDINKIEKIGSILKDADALDRTRFPGNLDTSKFRNKEVANELVLTSYNIKEADAKIEIDDYMDDLIDKIKSDNYSDEERKLLHSELLSFKKLYASKKYPDYVLNFARKYYGDFGFETIEEYADYILETKQFWR